MKSAITEYINAALVIPHSEAQLLAIANAKFAETNSALQRRLDSVSGSISGMIDRIASTNDPVLLPEYEKHTKQLLADKQSLESVLQELRQAHATTKIAIQDHCSGLKKFSAEELFVDDETTKSLIYRFISRVEVDDVNDTISVIFTE